MGLWGLIARYTEGPRADHDTGLVMTVGDYIALNIFHSSPRLLQLACAIKATMAKNRSQIDINIAAQLANVHRTTIFRAIRKGELTGCKLQQDGHKPQYMLDSEEFEAWMHKRGNVAQVAPEQEILQRSEPVQQEQVASLSLLHEFNKNLGEALRQADQARAQSLQILEENRRLERQVLTLQYEFRKYQLALTESSEALNEARARETQARLLLEERQSSAPPSPEPPLEALKEGRSDTSFTSKRRVGQWFRRLFGGG